MDSSVAALTRQAPNALPRRSPDENTTLLDLQEGLLAKPAHVNPKYLYDNLGSSLFTALTLLPEYYPTRCEAEILRTYASDISQHIGPVQSLIDLGAGDCVKAEHLFPHLKPARYVPVDISVDYLDTAVRRLTLSYPGLHITSVGQDFNNSLTLPSSIPPSGRLFFYPGSSIGNLDPDAAQTLLTRLRTDAPGGGLLIGVDRVKPADILERAYDDALHLTAAFNLNLLRHLNSVLLADFNVDEWRHIAFFNDALSRIEMHLQAQTAVTLTWPGGRRHFAAGERIHTENSYKFTPTGFRSLLERAGFTDVRHWSDSKNWFSVFSARS